MFILTDKEELDLKINKIKELNKINFLPNQAKLSQSTRLNPHHNKDKEIFKGEYNHQPLKSHQFKIIGTGWMFRVIE